MMRTSLILVGLALAAWAIVFGVLVLIQLSLRCRAGRRATQVVTGVWLVGGAFIALSPIAPLGAAGGVLAVLGFVSTPFVTDQRARLLGAGLVVTIIAVGGAWVGGLLVLPVGVVLYAAGLARTKLASMPIAATSVLALGLAVLSRRAGAPDAVVVEAVAASALAVGVALLRASRGGVPQRA